ncbi:hypothetical protein [Thermus sp.]|jgi:hypothetical protein|uniref:hypothetical protein n=1 Tax=Thermus sp. TaxID=275 RepID=UPI00321FE5C2
MRALFPLLLVFGAVLAQGLVLEDDLVQALELAPGGEAGLVLSLRNEGPNPLRVRVEVADYREDQGFLPPGSLPQSLAGTLFLEAPEVVVPPRGRARVGLRVQALSDLEGSRYAYLLLTPEPLSGAQGSGEGVRVGVNLVQRYAVLVAASHGGRPEVRFLEAKREGERLVFLGENRGSRLYRPLVRYQVVGAKGVVAEGYLGTYTFLPQNPKAVPVPLPRLAPGSYLVQLILDDGIYAYAVRARLDLP